MTECPWDTAPKTLEGLVASADAQGRWEKQHGPAPITWCIIPTRQMMRQICARILEMEKAVYGD